MQLWRNPAFVLVGKNKIDLKSEQITPEEERTKCIVPFCPVAIFFSVVQVKILLSFPVYVQMLSSIVRF